MVSSTYEDRFTPVSPGDFHSIGIDVQMDTSDPGDGRISENVIHPYPKPIGDGTEMNSLWKRIDFVYESLKIDLDKLSRFLHDNNAKYPELNGAAFEVLKLSGSCRKSS